jgi:hypothetical protein
MPQRAATSPVVTTTARVAVGVATAVAAAMTVAVAAVTAVTTAAHAAATREVPLNFCVKQITLSWR